MKILNFFKLIAEVKCQVELVYSKTFKSPIEKTTRALRYGAVKYTEAKNIVEDVYASTLKTPINAIHNKVRKKNWLMIKFNLYNIFHVIFCVLII